MKNRRNRDFLRICRRIISESTRPLTAAQIAKAAAESPAPEFYVTFPYARRRLSQLRRNGTDRNRSDGPTAAFDELRRRVDRLMTRKDITESEALALVLCEGNAPRFYLRPAAALFLYGQLRRKARQERNRRVHRHEAIQKPSRRYNAGNKTTRQPKETATT
ncbi:MAG: hypothetical protein K2G01_07365 [Paramuribaculum sp.]|nr:hypothetical protein [Paramuribaculum sp.]